MRLKVFGAAHLAHDDGEEVPLQPLAVALLAYLAVEGPRNRNHLGGLFWPNSKNALNSLSTTLNRIRALVPDGVWVRGNSLVGTDLPSDVADIRKAIDRSAFDFVTQIYCAPFLGTLKLRRRSLEFEDWVLEQRTTMAATVELALLHRGRDLYDAGDHHTAASVVEEAWEIALRDGFPSPDYFEVYHQILASAGRPSAIAVRSMAGELGIELLPVEPISLASNTEPAVSAGDPGAPGALPLFGCQEELDAIASSVISEKLTTVVGLGGSGKTRLAAEYFNSANAAQEFPNRYWVDLRDVADQDLVAPAIATSFGQRFDTVASLAEQVADDEPTLLVLDNFEHVLDAAGITKQLAHGNAALRILVTSRVPLAIAPESLINLRGLDTAEQEADSPAEQLFVSSARRAGVTDDRLSGPSRAAIVDVCRRVGGNPLALEIAGGWAQVLSPTEILEALSASNELLGSPITGGGRTMDAVLRQAWSTLAEVDQNTLMLLATFPGGCRGTEAFKLRELSIGSVGRLVQHSLVRLDIQGRFTLHPLVAGHALAELEQRPDQQQDFHQILSSWCQRFVATTEQPNVSSYSQAFDAEMANLVNSWSWDARHGLWELHRATLRPLRLFFAESGRFSEGRALFELLVDALRAETNPPQDVLAAALEAFAWFHHLSGDSSPARTLLAEALALTSTKDALARAQVLRSLGVVHLYAGEVDEAIANLTAGLALVGDDLTSLTAALQFDLAQAYHHRGDREQAFGAARLALQSGRTLNDLSVMARSYLMLGDVEYDPEGAIVLLNEGWLMAKEVGLDHVVIYFPVQLGLAHLRLKQANLAENYFTDGIEAGNDVGALPLVSGSYIGRAEARRLLGHATDAIADLKTGIRLALKTGTGRYLMWAAVVSCRVASASHTPTLHAKELLLLTLRHPATSEGIRNDAIEILRDVFDMTPPASPAPVSHCDEPSLDEVAERSLRVLALR